jgi:hypothetical protein
LFRCCPLLLLSLGVVPDLVTLLLLRCWLPVVLLFGVTFVAFTVVRVVVVVIRLFAVYVARFYVRCSCYPFTLLIVPFCVCITFDYVVTLLLLIVRCLFVYDCGLRLLLLLFCCSLFVGRYGCFRFITRTFTCCLRSHGSFTLVWLLRCAVTCSPRLVRCSACTSYVYLSRLFNCLFFVYIVLHVWWCFTPVVLVGWYWFTVVVDCLFTVVVGCCLIVVRCCCLLLIHSFVDLRYLLLRCSVVRCSLFVTFDLFGFYVVWLLRLFPFCLIYRLPRF